ncbi:PH domain-containing protein [Mycolicibacterium fallax]|uniref:Uncharacterized protein n=1 Tax=Mycolicibacterium fallax TaxID=1793 RepID=A0A1X1RE73_MYCFA|nr:hypothetical protein AWC04_09700 [Mycolicibacterium fallax]BBY97141.1 membrane protein [Mycolicibacterium fallax]
MASATQRAADWDAEFRPRKTMYLAAAAAVLIVAIHIGVALVLKIRNTGVNFRTSDQWSFVALGLVFAGLALLFTRPRLRIGAPGVAVRNLLGEKLIPWSQVRGLRFPAGKRFARLELPADEYLPVLAIQSFDTDRAVEAMDTARDLVAKYQD